MTFFKSKVKQRKVWFSYMKKKFLLYGAFSFNNFNYTFQHIKIKLKYKLKTSVLFMY